MNHRLNQSFVIPVLATLVIGAGYSCRKATTSPAEPPLDPALVAQGKEIFRTDTSGTRLSGPTPWACIR